MTTQQTPEQHVVSLLAATIEVWAHQLLFARRIYPSETFGPIRFLGVLTNVNRHPEVVSYISDSVKTMVPALVKGVAESVTFSVIDRAEPSGSVSVEVETYALCIKGLVLDWGQESDKSNMVYLLEKASREIILKTMSLKSGLTNQVETVSFLLTIQVPEENKSCDELNRGFANGSWFCSKDTVEKSAIEPLCQVSTPLYTISFDRQTK